MRAPQVLPVAHLIWNRSGLAGVSPLRIRTVGTRLPTLARLLQRISDWCAYPPTAQEGLTAS
jgi:hypothetical protein